MWSSGNGKDWDKLISDAPWGKRVGHASVVFNNKMWIIGGASKTRKMNDVWHSTDGISWTQATGSAAWSARKCHTAVVHDDKIWVIGGMDRFGRCNDVWYSSDGENWIEAVDSAPWAPRYLHNSFIFEDEMWVAGGHVDPVSGGTSDIWCSSDGVSWNEVLCSGSSWGARFGMESCVFNNQIWILGGINWKPFVFYHDVWCTYDVVGIEHNTPEFSFIIDIAPNPTAGDATISYSVPAVESVEIDVYDSYGRLVKRLVENSRHPSGYHTVSWNGCNETGTEVSAGVYYVKFRNGANSETRSLVRLQ